MSGDLIEFLNAQLDEDEQSARRQIGFIVQVESAAQVEAQRDPGKVDAIVVAPFDHLGAPGDPARVLREVEAKRRILADHQPRPRASGLHGLWCTTCHDDPDPEGKDYDVQPQAREWPCLTIRALALPYAGHKDFNPEWRP